jgi:hypothetical protein
LLTALRLAATVTTAPDNEPWAAAAFDNPDTVKLLRLARLPAIAATTPMDAIPLAVSRFVDDPINTPFVSVITALVTVPVGMANAVPAEKIIIRINALIIPS